MVQADYLCCALFAFVGASENVERKSHTGQCAILLWTLINVDSSQIYIDA